SVQESFDEIAAIIRPAPRGVRHREVMKRDSASGRDAWSGASSRLADEVRGDLRPTLRTFARNKAFTATAVCTLALAIGANTAVFSLLDSVLLRLLPVTSPEELVEVMLPACSAAPGARRMPLDYTCRHD